MTEDFGATSKVPRKAGATLPIEQMLEVLWYLKDDSSSSKPSFLSFPQETNLSGAGTNTRRRKSTERHRLYMDVGYSLTEEALRNYFKQLCETGRVLDVYLPKHASGRNKGYGFTTFESEDDLITILQQREHIVEDIPIKVSRAGPRPPRDDFLKTKQVIEACTKVEVLHQPPDLTLSLQLEVQPQMPVYNRSARLHINGVPDDITEDQIRVHFMRWGNVVDIYFPGKNGEKRLNYCFVAFDKWLDAQRACSQSDRSINSRPVFSISIAEPRHMDLKEGQAPERQPSGTTSTGYSSANGNRPELLQSVGLCPAVKQTEGMDLGTVLHSTKPVYLPPLSPPAAVRPFPGVKYVNDSLQEQLLMNCIGSGAIAHREESQYFQQAPTTIQTWLQDQADSLPPGALQSLQASTQKNDLSSSLTGLTNPQLIDFGQATKPASSKSTY